MSAELESALEPVRALVEADGGVVEAVGLADGVASLRLVLDDAECRECVMPREFLEQVALDLMGPALAGLIAVEIDDPRE